MSNRHLTLAWKLDEGLSGPTKFVLVRLADRADRLGVCWPSQASLARDCLMKRRTVNRHIGILKAKGLLYVKRNGPGQANDYILTLPGDPEPALTPPVAHEPTPEVAHQSEDSYATEGPSYATSGVGDTPDVAQLIENPHEPPRTTETRIHPGGSPRTPRTSRTAEEVDEGSTRQTRERKFKERGPDIREYTDEDGFVRLGQYTDAWQRRGA